MEEAVLQWHSHICPLPQGWELLESNLLHLQSVEQMQCGPGAPAWNWELFTQRIGEAPWQTCSLCSLTKILLLDKGSI